MGRRNRLRQPPPPVSPVPPRGTDVIQIAAKTKPPLLPPPIHPPLVVRIGTDVIKHCQQNNPPPAPPTATHDTSAHPSPLSHVLRNDEGGTNPGGTKPAPLPPQPNQTTLLFTHLRKGASRVPSKSRTSSSRRTGDTSVAVAARHRLLSTPVKATFSSKVRSNTACREGGGRGTQLLHAIVIHSAIDHACLSRRSAAPTPKQRHLQHLGAHYVQAGEK